MNKSILENTKVATYFLWEYTRCEDASALWHCAEEIAHFFEKNEIEKIEDIYEILKKGKKAIEYKCLLRNISYHIHLHSKNFDSQANWYVAEKLLYNGEWCRAMISVANELKKNKGDFKNLKGLHSEEIKKHYSQQ